MRYLAVLVIICAASAPAWAATISAVSCSPSAVQTAVNSAADGDTVQIPAGTCSWTSTVSVTKAITLQGAGIDVTVVKDDISSRGPMLVFDTPAGKNWRWSGMTVTAGAVTGANWNGAIRLSGGAKAFRIDHIRINDLASQTGGIGFWGDLWGVIDHSIFITSRGSELIIPQHVSWQGIGGNGDNSWAQPVSPGSAQAIYIEDNVFTNTGGQKNIIDGYRGARYVVRNNVFNGANLENHGTDTSGRFRSIRWIEAYRNTFHGSLSVYINVRGGAGVVFDNTVTSGAGVLVNAQNFRDCGQAGNLCVASKPWGKCDGSGAWDQNTSGQGGYACLDQVGRGHGALLTGATPATGWPNQALDPLYVWNNTLNGASAVGNGVSKLNIQVGRDVITGPRPGYTPLVYPHPLVTGTTRDSVSQHHVLMRGSHRLGAGRAEREGIVRRPTPTETGIAMVPTENR